MSQYTEAEISGALASRTHLDFMRFHWQKTTSPLAVGEHTKAICERIDRAIADFRIGKSTYLVIKVAYRHGKLLADDTPVLTFNKGWITHGELKIGDLVAGREGRPVKVMAVSPSGYADNLIKFSDGSSIVAHDNHEWVVYDECKHKEIIIETKDMIGIERRGYCMRGRFYLGCNNKICFKEKQLPIHPYVLGAWLGDGSTGKNCINHSPADVEVVKKIEAIGYSKTSVFIHPTTNVMSTYFKSLCADLKKAGVRDKKRVPDIYLYSSVKQRLELLAGLIDTDGYINKKDGRLFFSNTNILLIEAVKKIVNSLGQRVTVCKYPPVKSSSGIQGKKAVYQLLFVPPCDIPTAIPRKKIKIIASRLRRRSIVKITKCKSEIGKCIQVEGGIYLAGETLIPTHNSEIVARNLPPRFIGLFPDMEVILATYGSSLSEELSRDAIKIMDSEAYKYTFPNVRINPRHRSAETWGVEVYNKRENRWIESMGKVRWPGLEGSITGKGGDLTIVDDAIRGREEAESETIRNKKWEIIKDDLFSRLGPVHIVIFMGTPWHVDDMFAKIEREMAADPEFPRFENMTFPARKMNKETGEFEYLFLDRYPIKWYKTQYALGEYRAAGLLDCCPTLRKGNKLKTENVKKIKSCPEDIVYTLGWDLASSKKERAKDDPDYTVGVKLGVRWEGIGLMVDGKEEMKAILYIDDVVRGQWEAPERDTKIKEVCLRERLTVGVEAFGAYKDAYVILSRLLWGVRVVKKVQLSGDKVAKSDVLEASFEAGNVYMKRAPWNEEVLKEIADFPSGRHDDVVDALVVAFHCHNPHQTHVWSERVALDVIKPFSINFNKISEYSTLVCSNWVERSMETGVLIGLWNGLKGALFLWGEGSYQTPQPGMVVVDVSKKMKEWSGGQISQVDKFEWFGNKRIFGGKGDMDLQMAYLNYNCFVRDNDAYEEYGAVQMVNRLLQNKKLWVHPRCEELLRQMGEWSVDGNKLAEGNVLARALCNMVSALKETGKMEPPQKGMAHYSKERRDFTKRVNEALADGTFETMSDEDLMVRESPEEMRWGWM